MAPTPSAPDRQQASPIGRIVLIAAALVAIVAISIAIWKSRASDAAPAAQAAAPAAPVGDLPSMIGGLEAKLQANPGDANGWNMLAWSYSETGRYADAARAYEKAAKLLPDNSGYWSALGEARVLAGPGGVTPEAEAAFGKALAIDPRDHRARYFMAVKKDQAGDHKGAIDDWIGVLKDTPAGAPWEQPVRDLVTKVAAQNKIDIAGRVPPPATPIPGATPGPGAEVAAAAIPGPSRDQMQAASSLPPGEQDAMVRGMVDRLAARLKDNPKDGDGWIRLMRARMVLNDVPGATRALSDGRAAFAGDPAEQSKLADAARTLGVPQ